jgi:hypothetical protein
MIGSGYSLTAGLGKVTIAHSLRTNFAEWLKLNERKLIQRYKCENAVDWKKTWKEIPAENPERNPAKKFRKRLLFASCASRSPATRLRERF